MWRRHLQILSIILLTGFSFFSALQYWRAVRRSLNPNFYLNDPETNWEKRILAAHLPDNVGGEIGYVADWDIDPNANSIDQDEEYVLTQYTLAPIIVKRGGGYEWIIGNLTAPNADAWLNQKFAGDKTHFYGWGIYLIHKVNP